MTELCRIEGQQDILQRSKWVVIQNPIDRELVRRLLLDLDVGESEAIALAVELKADYLIIDEHTGREAAQSLGIPIVGLLGVLTAAKAAGHIVAARPIIEEMVANGFHLHAKLIKTVLAGLNE